MYADSNSVVRKSGFGLVVLALFGIVPVIHRDTLYGITADDNLISINTSNPGSATLINPLEATASSIGIFGSGNSLYIYDTNNNVLRQINPATAASVATINLGLTVAPGEGDMTFSNGVGYLASSDQPDGSFNGLGTLYKFSLSSNSATVLSTNIPLVDGLTLSPTGVLYGLEQGGAKLDTIDTTTGAITSSLATGINTNCGGFACYSYGGLTFGPSGTLFADLTNFSNPTSDFFLIDPATGAATADGNLPFDQVDGLTTIVPEPASLLLVSLSSLCFARLKTTIKAKAAERDCRAADVSSRTKSYELPKNTTWT